MIRMVAHAKLLLNDCRDALSGPDLADKPKGFGAQVEQMGELCELLGGQPGRRAGRWLAV
jgi:hypothetical protein